MGSVAEITRSASSRYIFAGKLQRDFTLFPSGETLFDKPGGNLLYAAAGLLVWEPDTTPGLLARVGEDYPGAWLGNLQQRGLDIRGIRVLSNVPDTRHFTAYLDLQTPQEDNPVSHFARLGLPFPKALLGYQCPANLLDSRTRLAPTSLHPEDLIPEYQKATIAHMCPVDYLTHSLLPVSLRQAGFTTITLDPSKGYMDSSFYNDVPALLVGLTAFLPSEEELRALFQGRSSDLWEMAEALTVTGCEIIVIKRGERGQMVYESAGHKRWEIPAYPARRVDPTGVGDAFCGGFLAGYCQSFDPLEAALHGNISAALTLEGSGIFYALEALPGLGQARLESLRQAVRQV